jgi:hypothetical protein
MTVKITQPDGTTKTLGPFTSDATGGTSTTFVPDQLGNYSFQMSFAGQTLANNNPAPFNPPSEYVGDYFMPSTSPLVTLLVQQEPIPQIPTTPLPTEYWTRPINSVNTQWSTISGNWLGLAPNFDSNTGDYSAGGNYNPYTTAPTTSHILWSKPEGFGGLLGGEFGSSDTSVYMTTNVYQSKFEPIIINGILYYTIYPGSTPGYSFQGGTSSATGFTAVDLRTGQTLWTNSPPMGNTSTVLYCGQTLDFVSPNQYGAIAYLWTTGVPPEISSDQIITGQFDASTLIGYTTEYAPITLSNGPTFNMYDAATGKYILSIVNASFFANFMTMTTDASGSLIGYYTDPMTNTLNCWNSTQAILYPAGQTPGAHYWEWDPPQNTVIPFSAGIMWSQPLATNISGVPLPSPLSTPQQNPGSFFTVLDEKAGIIVLTSNIQVDNAFLTGYQIEAGYSLTTGKQLWITNRTETPYSRLTMGLVDDGVYTEISEATGGIAGYSITTGQQLWKNTLTTADGGSPNAYDSIGGYYTQNANGVQYINGFGGDIWALNITTGNMIWYTNTNELQGSPGTTTPYGVWPIWSFQNPGAIANGILFLSEGHAYSPPMFNGARELAINTTNGQLVWSVLGFNVNGGTAIADGIMTTYNGYDGQIYAYGKGASKLTVTAPNIGVTTATPLTITGTITDISAGTQQDAVVNNYPNGLPCVSDASMSNFMEAVYMQQQMPSNITGVPITISVLDANGNYRTIGTTTSDASGTFAFNWTPDITGAYTIYAAFAGSESYYASNAVAHLYASEQTTTTPQPTQTPSAADLYFLPAIAGLFVAIIICIAMIALVLKKHP